MERLLFDGRLTMHVTLPGRARGRCGGDLVHALRHAQVAERAPLRVHAALNGASALSRRASGSARRGIVTIAERGVQRSAEATQTEADGIDRPALAHLRTPRRALRAAGAALDVSRRDDPVFGMARLGRSRRACSRRSMKMRRARAGHGSGDRAHRGERADAGGTRGGGAALCARRGALSCHLDGRRRIHAAPARRHLRHALWRLQR